MVFFSLRDSDPAPSHGHPLPPNWLRYGPAAARQPTFARAAHAPDPHVSGEGSSPTSRIRRKSAATARSSPSAHPNVGRAYTGLAQCPTTPPSSPRAAPPPPRSPATPCRRYSRGAKVPAAVDLVGRRLLDDEDRPPSFARR